MDCQNKLIFKYYVHLFDGSRRLHQSGTSVHIRHCCFADMISQAAEVVSTRLGMRGSISVFFPGDERIMVTSGNFHMVRYNETLTVEINV